jgi:predicted transglutaminase-like cysteine proteinase
LITHKRGDLGESLRRLQTLDSANPPVGNLFTLSQRLTRARNFQLAQIGFDTPVLPPIGHSRFCLRYPGDCEVHGMDFRRRNIALTPERWNELNTVNREVNRDIIPELTIGSGTTEEWLISPRTGDCNSYAVTKRDRPGEC